MSPYTAEYHRKLVADRAKEIEENKLGYLGESEFCNAQCAAFFARTCIKLFNYLDAFPDRSEERIAMVTNLAAKIFKWVAEREPR